MGQFFLAILLQQPAGSPGDDAIEEAIAKSMAEGGPFSRYGPFGWPGALIPMMSTLSFFAVVVLIGWLIYRWNQLRLQARTEFHRQLLDKFTSGGEFAAFLNSSGGQSTGKRKASYGPTSAVRRVTQRLRMTSSRNPFCAFTSGSKERICTGQRRPSSWITGGV
jgi:hypothetical protein